MRRSNNTSKHPRAKPWKNEARKPDGSFGRSATRRKRIAEEKAQDLGKVEVSPDSKGKVLTKLELSKSDCCRWRARARQGSVEDRRHPGPSLNRLSPHDESLVFDVAPEHTDVSISFLSHFR
tara:strand:+ start:804 stop:1169 length:366 start_codon:yes stop_codon:yes gene_type:complete